MTEPQPASKKPRRSPSQKRSEHTFELILAATAELLADARNPPITTNHIAQRAGINIATLYQYFAGKDEILLAVFKRQAGERLHVAVNRLAEPSALPWQVVLGAVMDATIELRRSQPGHARLRRMMQTLPALKEVDRTASLRKSQAIADEILRHCDLDPTKAREVAQIVVDMLTASFDLWESETPRLPQHKLIEAKHAMLAYVASYLEPTAKPQRTAA